MRPKTHRLTGLLADQHANTTDGAAAWQAGELTAEALAERLTDEQAAELVNWEASSAFRSIPGERVFAELLARLGMSAEEFVAVEREARYGGAEPNYLRSPVALTNGFLAALTRRVPEPANDSLHPYIVHVTPSERH